MPGAPPALLPTVSADGAASSSGFQTVGGPGASAPINASNPSVFRRSNSLNTGAGDASDMQSADGGNSARAGPAGIQHYDMFDSNSEHFSMHTAGLNIDEARLRAIVAAQGN